MAKRAITSGLSGPDRSPVITEYSKPSADIRTESARRFRTDQTEFKRQAANQIGSHSSRLRNRRVCIVCARALRGDRFLHRRNVFIICSSCGHLQSARMPPSTNPEVEFDAIYPSLSARQYRERRERIYTPKLDWIVRSLRSLGTSPRQLKAMRWVEIGAGAGYFLSALSDYGVRTYGGFDGNRALVATANRALKADLVRHELEPNLSKAIQKYPADIYVAFFVLEHVEDAHAFFQQLKRLPAGTVFVFAVPVFGLSVLLDGVFERNFARQLDGIVHRQLYTDESLRHAVALAGFTIAAEWIFGQDADDLSRFLLQNLQNKYSARVFRKVSSKLLAVQDEVQQVLDRARLADQRHVIAIKR